MTAESERRKRYPRNYNYSDNEKNHVANAAPIMAVFAGCVFVVGVVFWFAARAFSALGAM